MSDLSLLLRGYADAVDDQFRPVDADALRERDPAPPGRTTGRVVRLRPRTDNRLLLVAAAAIVIFITGTIAFAQRGTQDPSSVSTIGGDEIITGGPSTSSSTSTPPCPAGSVNGCVDGGAIGTSLPGTVPGSVAPDTVAPTPVPPPSGGTVDPNITTPSAPVVGGAATTTRVVLVPPPTTRPATPSTSTSTSTSTTTTTPPTTGRIRGSRVCDPGPCPLGFPSTHTLFRMWPNPSSLTMSFDGNNQYDMVLEPGSYSLGVHSSCEFIGDSGNRLKDFDIEAGERFDWGFICTQPGNG